MKNPAGLIKTFSTLCLGFVLILPLNVVSADDSVSEFAQKLCIGMMTAGERGRNIVMVMEYEMLTYTGIADSDPAYLDYLERNKSGSSARSELKYLDPLVAFYNEHQNEFICKGKVTSRTRESEHILKRAVALSLHNSVLYKFFLNSMHTDVNAIEFVMPDPKTSNMLTHAPWGTGEPETLLDYLNKVLADPDLSKKYVISDIEKFKRVLIGVFEAKTAAELITDGSLQP